MIRMFDNDKIQMLRWIIGRSNKIRPFETLFRQKFLSWFLFFEQLRFISIRFCSQRRVTLYEKFRCALVLLVLICIGSLKVYSCLSSKFQLLTKLDFISLPVSEHKHWNNRHSMYRRKLSETAKKTFLSSVRHEWISVHEIGLSN